MISRISLRGNVIRSFARQFSKGINVGQPAVSSAPSSSSSNVTDVPGLSSAVVHPANQPVGPGVDPKKSGAYKVPEYFCYDNMSFFEAEIEMSKYRMPQPSSLKKWNASFH